MCKVSPASGSVFGGTFGFPPFLITFYRSKGLYRIFSIEGLLLSSFLEFIVLISPIGLVMSLSSSSSIFISPPGSQRFPFMRQALSPGTSAQLSCPPCCPTVLQCCINRFPPLHLRVVRLLRLLRFSFDPGSIHPGRPAWVDGSLRWGVRRLLQFDERDVPG